MVSMVEREQIDSIYSFSDATYITPENVFKQNDLDKLKPYHIFTGIGVAVTYEIDSLVNNDSIEM